MNVTTSLFPIWGIRAFALSSLLISGMANATSYEPKLAILGGVSALNSTKSYGLSVYQLKGEGQWGFGGSVDVGRIGESDRGANLNLDFYSARIALTYGVTDNIYIVPSAGIVQSKLDRNYYYAGRYHYFQNESTGFSPALDFVVESDGLTASVGMSQLPLVDRNETAFNFKVGYAF
jgi:hypothetical protein